MCIYLYKKTHNVTGLKYLGKTTHKDPYKYRGSGNYWIPHIKKHGYDVTTEILKECKTNEEIKYWGKYYSDLWNVVNERGPDGRKTWANLKPEEGNGGANVTPWNKGKTTGSQSEETKAKRSATMKGKPAHNKGIPNPKVAEANKRNKTGVPRSEESRKAISRGGKGKKMTTVVCPNCSKEGGRGNMLRYHFSNCKFFDKR